MVTLLFKSSKDLMEGLWLQKTCPYPPHVGSLWLPGKAVGSVCGPAAMSGVTAFWKGMTIQKCLGCGKERFCWGSGQILFLWSSVPKVSLAY